MNVGIKISANILNQYFTDNDKGIVCFDRKNDTFSYYGAAIGNASNQAYKPSPMEIRKVGFNILGDDLWVQTGCNPVKMLNLLSPQKIAEKCEVVVVGCKPAEIPTPDVDMGLTEPVEKAIPKTIDIILNEIGVK